MAIGTLGVIVIIFFFFIMKLLYRFALIFTVVKAGQVAMKQGKGKIKSMFEEEEDEHA